MPTFDRLAEGGLSFNRFHTTALCSPTRQALLTGRNHHSAEMGAVCELATSLPGNTSARPNSVATVAEMLKLNGDNTAAFGKMHQTPVWEISTSGPFDRWPTGDGFEKFWGFMGGETNQWEPIAGLPLTKPSPTGSELADRLDRAGRGFRLAASGTPSPPTVSEVGQHRTVARY